jgi:hypothetical protein
MATWKIAGGFNYPVAHIFQKILGWFTLGGPTDECRAYFALSSDGETWTYYSCDEDDDHALASGLKLTNWGTDEDSAQDNYVLIEPETNTKKFVAVLPLMFEASYVRMYVDSDAGSLQLHEFHPSTYFVADEIISGVLDITDDFLNKPLIRVRKRNDAEIQTTRLQIGEYWYDTSDRMGIIGYDSDSSRVFELSDADLFIGGWTITPSSLTGSANITVQEGGDIILEGTSTNEAVVRFKRAATSWSVNTGIRYDADVLCFWPSTRNTGTVYFGYTPHYSAGENFLNEYKFSEFRVDVTRDIHFMVSYDEEHANGASIYLEARGVGVEGDLGQMRFTVVESGISSTMTFRNGTLFPCPPSGSWTSLGSEGTCSPGGGSRATIWNRIYAGGTSGFVQLKDSAQPTNPLVDRLKIWTDQPDYGASSRGLCIKDNNGYIVMISRHNAVSSPSGGGTIDTQARTAIDGILDILDKTGLMTGSNNPESWIPS